MVAAEPVTHPFFHILTCQQFSSPEVDLESLRRQDFVRKLELLARESGFDPSEVGTLVTPVLSRKQNVSDISFIRPADQSISFTPDVRSGVSQPVQSFSFEPRSGVAQAEQSHVSAPFGVGSTPLDVARTMSRRDRQRIERSDGPRQYVQPPEGLGSAFCAPVPVRARPVPERVSKSASQERPLSTSYLGASFPALPPMDHLRNERSFREESPPRTSKRARSPEDDRSETGDSDDVSQVLCN